MAVTKTEDDTVYETDLLHSNSVEPNWLTGDLGSYPVSVKDYIQTLGFLAKEDVYQQSDLLKPMMDDIVRYGLNYTYQKYHGGKLPIMMTQAPGGKQLSQPKVSPTPTKYSKTSNKKHIIIVGAGLAGLSAAYELTKVGHDVDILEMQNRVGGRVLTLREKDGFSKYCHTEGN